MLFLACPPGSFFYNGSCYFYLPPKQTDSLKGLGFTDVSVDEGNWVRKSSIDEIRYFSRKSMSTFTCSIMGYWKYQWIRLCTRTNLFSNTKIWQSSYCSEFYEWKTSCVTKIELISLLKWHFFLVLHLKKRLGEQQFLSVGNTNDYSLIYKPLPDLPPANTCLIIDISKAMQRISLEEKFRLERRSNHYICKLSMFIQWISFEFNDEFF